MAAHFYSEHVKKRTKIDLPDGEGDVYHFDIKPDDTGTMTHNGRIYKGRFLVSIFNNVIESIRPSHSPFTIEYENGDVYEGEVDQQFKERGEATYHKKEADGSLRLEYKGFYFNGMRFGMGIRYYPATMYYPGSTYIGQFVAGKPNGKGTITYQNGDSYRGEFRNARFHGHGVYTYADGKTVECTEFRKSKRGGTCTITLPNGDVETREYEGKRSKRSSKRTKKLHSRRRFMK